MSSLPRAGSCDDSAKEIYLFNNLGGAAPTNATEVSQAGVTFGPSQPTTTNLGDVSVAIAGSMRQALSANPTLYVKAVDMQATVAVVGMIGRQATPGRKSMDRAGHFGARNVHRRPQERGSRRRAIVGVASQVAGADITRVAIKRTSFGSFSDADYVGIAPEFKRFTDVSCTTEVTSDPSGAVLSVTPVQDNGDDFTGGPYTAVDQASVVTLADGTLLTAWLTVTGSSLYGIEIKALRPWTDASWQHFKGYDNLRDVVSDTTDFAASALSMFTSVDKREVYIAIVFARGFHILRVSGSLDIAAASRSLVQVGEMVPFGVALVTSDTIAAAMTANGCVVAQSLVTSTNTVMLSRSSDLRTWGSAVIYTATTIRANSAGYFEDTANNFPPTKKGDTVTVLNLGANYAKTWVVVDGVGDETQYIHVNTNGLTFPTLTPSAGTNVSIIIHSPSLESLSDLRHVTMDLEPDEVVTAMDYADSFAVAVTNKGRIFQNSTTTPGDSWTEAQSPVSAENTLTHREVPLYAVKVFSSSVAYACGADSVILKYTGDWKCRWIALKDTIAEDFKANTDTMVGSNEGTYRAIDFKSATTGWLCGDKGIVRYTEDSANNWSVVLPADNSGELNCLRHVPTSDKNIVVAGTAQGASGFPSARIHHITDAYPGGYTSANADVSVPSVDSIVGVFVAATGSGSNNQIFAVDSAGNVISSQFNLTNYVRRASIPDAAATCIFYDEANTNLHIGGTSTKTGGGMLWKSDTAPYNEFSAEGVPLTSITTIWQDTAVIRAALGSGAMYADSALDSRFYPSLLTLQNGNVALSCTNLTRKTIEFYKANDGRSPFYFTDEVTPDISSNGGSVYETDSWGSGGSVTALVPRSHLFVDANGIVCAQVGQEGFSSLDDGETWVERRNSALPVALGALRPTGTAASTYNAEAINRSRCTTALADGRLISTVIQGQSSNRTAVSVWMARVWLAIPDDGTDQDRQYMPIIPGRQQWSGIDGMNIIFNGYPLSGDSWTFEPKYDYQVQNIVVPSVAGAYWRSAANPASDIDIEWDRNDSAVIAALGSHGLWEIAGVALFGTNIPTASFDYVLGGTYTPQTLSAVVDSGTTTSSGILGTLTASAKTWVPGQFKPGDRQFYCQVSSNGSAPAITDPVYKVRENGGTQILLDTETTIASGRAFTVFGDRMVTLPSGYSTSNNRLSRYFRIRLPGGQATAEGYYKAAAIIAGPYVAYQQYTGNESRARFDGGFKVKLQTNSIEQTGQTGVTSVRTFGRTSAVWSIEYGDQLWHDRDMLLNPFINEMRQPFCFIPQADIPTTAILARLADGPDIGHVARAGDRFATPLTIRELP